MVRVLSVPGRHHENRYFGLLADALERQGITIVPVSKGKLLRFAYDVLHINFPTHYITESGLFRALSTSLILGAYLALARLLGRRIVYSVHDNVPFRSRHEPLLSGFLWLAHRLSNAFIFLSQSSRADFAARYPAFAAKPWVTALHGPYPTRIMTDAARTGCRRELMGEDGDFLVAFVGAIKPYKDIAALATLPTQLADGRRVRILVAGRVEAGHEAAVDAVLRQLPPGSLIRIDRRVLDPELDRLIQAADIVMLPYLKGWNSGAALLVLSNEGRMVLSDLPIFVELAQSPGPPWVYSAGRGADRRADFAQALRQAAANPPTAADRAGLRAYLKAIGQDEGARLIAALYHDVLHHDVRRPEVLR